MGAGAKTASGYGRFSKVDLKHRGMRWLAWFSRKQDREDALAFLRESPKIAREEWAKIKDPRIKYEVAIEMKRLYQEMGEWDRPRRSIRDTRNVLEEYFEIVRSPQEDTT